MPSGTNIVDHPGGRMHVRAALESQRTISRASRLPNRHYGPVGMDYHVGSAVTRLVAACIVQLCLYPYLNRGHQSQAEPAG